MNRTYIGKRTSLYTTEGEPIVNTGLGFMPLSDAIKTRDYHARLLLIGSGVYMVVVIALCVIFG